MSELPKKVEALFYLVYTLYTQKMDNKESLAVHIT